MLTMQTLIDFITKQPDDRQIEMGEAGSGHECGCMLVHFGREQLKWDRFHCGMQSIEEASTNKVETGGDQVYDLIASAYERGPSLNYGVVKEILKDKGYV